MASIDGFLDHFDAEPVPRQVLRASLRRLQPPRRESFEISNVLLWLLVALLHVGLFLALDFAMRPLPIVHDAADAPMQVTIIRLPELAVPGVTAQPVSQPDIHRLLHPQHVLPRANIALQAIPTLPHTVMQTATTPSTGTRPALDLYDRQGGIRLPAPAIAMR